MTLPAHRVIGHKEYGNTPPGGWSGRKQDPVYDMDWRRDQVANFTPRNTAAPVQEDDMPLFIAAPGRGHALVWPGFVKYLPGGIGANQEELDAAIAEFGPFTMLTTREFDVRVALRMNVEMSPQAINGILDAPIERNEKAGGGTTTLRAQAHWEDYNFRTVTPEAVAKAVGTPDVDADTLAKALARPEVAASIGEAMAAATDRRVRDGDPATGPVS